MTYYQLNPTWQSIQAFHKNRAPKKLQNWLTDRGSLTHALINNCSKEFSVRVLNEAWQKPTPNESQTLGLKPNSLAYIRQVHLFCGNKAWVYARSIIPENTLHGELQKLTQLGTKPLGAILFANKHIQRGDIEIAKISSKHKIHSTALLFSTINSDTIWGRRSLFHIANKPLLVSEIFLPEIPEKLQ